MRIELLRELHETRPFVPFTMILADGRRLSVIHNEFLSIFPGGRAAIRFSLKHSLAVRGDIPSARPQITANC